MTTDTEKRLEKFWIENEEERFGAALTFDKVLEFVNIEHQAWVDEVVKEIGGMKKEYSWCNDGFDPDVPYGHHLAECERHYRMAIEDIIALLKEKGGR